MGISKGIWVQRNACAFFTSLIYSQEVAWAAPCSSDIDLRSSIADGSRVRYVPWRTTFATCRYRVWKRNCTSIVAPIIPLAFSISEHYAPWFYVWIVAITWHAAYKVREILRNYIKYRNQLAGGVIPVLRNKFSICVDEFFPSLNSNISLLVYPVF